MKLKLGMGIFFLVGLLIATCAAQDSCIAPSCSKCPALEVNDKATTKQITYNNTRNYKYGEFIITCPGQPSGIWNTIGMNNLPGYPDDSIPAPIWNNWSADAVAKQYGATACFGNAPRHWTMDKLTVMVSNNVRNLDGLDTRWVADIASAEGNLNYVPTNVSCNRTWFFAKDKPIFILDAPDGTPFVMQSYSLIVDPNLTLKDLLNIGPKLNLPAGWKYRTEVLKRDLTINGINGTEWHVTQDALQNKYSACWISGNQTSCNFQP
jgi:hypothetical protein